MIVSNRRMYRTISKSIPNAKEELYYSKKEDMIIM